MQGEGLLGPLRPRYSVVFAHLPGRTQYLRRYLDATTGEMQVQHPRLSPHIEGWQMHDTDGHPWYENVETGDICFHPALLPHALRARGVDLRTFDLV